MDSEGIPLPTVSSKVKSSNGFGAPAPDMPFHFTQDSSCRSKGQTCFVEVAVGSRNVDHFPEDEKRGSLSEGFSYLNRTLIYPVEAVLLPVLYKAFEKSSPKRYFGHEPFFATGIINWFC